MVEVDQDGKMVEPSARFIVHFIHHSIRCSQHRFISQFSFISFFINHACLRFPISFVPRDES